MIAKGHSFNESEIFLDKVTGRPSRRLTTGGLYNETPTYHLNAAFSADSRYLVFGTLRDGIPAVMRAEVATGELTVLMTGEPVPGADGDDLHEQALSAFLGGEYTGNAMAMVQASGWAAAVYHNTLRVVHIETLEERELLGDVPRELRITTPGGTPDGKKIIITRVQEHPDVLAGKLVPNKGYYEAFARLGGRPATYLEVDIDSGACREVYREETAGSNHVQVCPVDNDLWLIDRDWPPRFGHGGDGKTTRAWLLNARTMALTELRARNAGRFQIHTNWNARGDRVYYHGPADEGGMYIGACDTTGTVLWEHRVPTYFYGHTSTHTQAEAIVTDGLVSSSLITALYYEDADSFGAPRIEILGCHDSEWNSLPGQFSHPHCHMSPDGRWLAYNRSQGQHSDVCVLQLKG